MPLLLIACTVAAVSQAPDSRWEVRRARTTDANVAGCYPEWSVEIQDGGDSLDVRIDEPEGAQCRGSIIVGRQLPAAEKDERGRWIIPRLHMEFTSECGLGHRGGEVAVGLITLAEWQRLTDDPLTETQWGPDGTGLWEAVHRATETDAREPQEWVGPQRIGDPSAIVSELYVLVIAFTGYHGEVERFSARVAMDWAPLRDQRWLLFERLDLDSPGIETVRNAVEADDLDAAEASLLAAMRNRPGPRMAVDWRHRERGGYEASDDALRTAREALDGYVVPNPSYPPSLMPGGDVDWLTNTTPDNEWIWQLNRQYWWNDLGVAYWATGDEAFAQCFIRQMEDWVADCSPGTAVAWRTIEVGIRGHSWADHYMRFLGSPSLTPRAHAAMVRSLSDHALYLLPAERFSSRSNWGLMESEGLLTIGVLFPEFRDASEWVETGLRRLEGELTNQVYPDGGQRELSPSYHSGCITWFHRPFRLAADNGWEVAPEATAVIERMFDWLAKIIKPNLEMPMVGDSWAGSYAGAIQRGIAEYGREDWRYIVTGGAEGTPPAHTSILLPDSGYAAMRSGWRPTDTWVFFKASPWGGGHMQEDNLQIILHGAGETLMPDSGSYRYFGEGRAEFRRSMMHSLVTVGGADVGQATPEITRWETTDEYDLISAEQESGEVLRQRTVLFVKPGVLLVADEVRGTGEAVVDAWWQLAPGECVVDPATGEAMLTTERGAGLLVRPLDLEGLGVTVEEGAVSHRYNERRERPRLRHSRIGPLPSRFLTLLAVGESPEAARAEAEIDLEPWLDRLR